MALLSRKGTCCLQLAYTSTPRSRPLVEVDDFDTGTPLHCMKGIFPDAIASPDNFLVASYSTIGGSSVNFKQLECTIQTVAFHNLLATVLISTSLRQFERG